MNQPVYDELVAAARAGGVLSSTDLTTAADLDVTIDGHARSLGDMLDEIALHEIRAARSSTPRSLPSIAELYRNARADIVAIRDGLC